MMGWLTATYAGAAYTHRSKPALKLPASVFPDKGATVKIGTAKTYDAEPLHPAVVFDAACAPYVTFPRTPETRRRPPPRHRQPPTSS